MNFLRKFPVINSSRGLRGIIPKQLKRSKLEQSHEQLWLQLTSPQSWKFSLPLLSPYRQWMPSVALHPLLSGLKSIFGEYRSTKAYNDNARDCVIIMNKILEGRTRSRVEISHLATNCREKVSAAAARLISVRFMDFSCWIFLDFNLCYFFLLESCFTWRFSGNPNRFRLPNSCYSKTRTRHM